MTNLNLSSSRVGQEAKYVRAEVTATKAATALAVGGSALPAVSVMGPVVMAGLPVALGVGLATYGVCKLLDRVFD